MLSYSHHERGRELSAAFEGNTILPGLDTVPGNQGPCVGWMAENG